MMDENATEKRSEAEDRPRSRGPDEKVVTIGSKHVFYKIRPRRGVFDGIDLSELWNYRDLLYFLVWRDVLVRYKQTLLGAAWALFQPLMAMVIFAVVFGRLARMPSDGLPYPVFSYSALVLWTLLAQSVTQAANSLILNERLVTKCYFPRVLVPAAPVMSCLLDFAIASSLFLFLMPYYGVGLSAHIWAAPIMVFLTLMVAMGVGLWAAALNVMYRDLRYVIPFMTQIWLFASPVVYPSSIIPERWKLIYAINPMVGAIEGFRWSLLGIGPSPWQVIGISAISAFIILVLGSAYFQKSEESFADLL